MRERRYEGEGVTIEIKYNKYSGRYITNTNTVTVY